MQLEKSTAIKEHPSEDQIQMYTLHLVINPSSKISSKNDTYKIQLTKPQPNSSLSMRRLSPTVKSKPSLNGLSLSLKTSPSKKASKIAPKEAFGVFLEAVTPSKRTRLSLFIRN
jgi:hypothetical protein